MELKEENLIGYLGILELQATIIHKLHNIQEISQQSHLIKELNDLEKDLQTYVGKYTINPKLSKVLDITLNKITNNTFDYKSKREILQELKQHYHIINLYKDTDKIITVLAEVMEVIHKTPLWELNVEKLRNKLQSPIRDFTIKYDELLTPKIIKLNISQE